MISRYKFLLKNIIYKILYFSILEKIIGKLTSVINILYSWCPTQLKWFSVHFSDWRRRRRHLGLEFLRPGRICLRNFTAISSSFSSKCFPNVSLTRSSTLIWYLIGIYTRSLPENQCLWFIIFSSRSAEAEGPSSSKCRGKWRQNTIVHW
jgi:hypothetical protein